MSLIQFVREGESNEANEQRKASLFAQLEAKKALEDEEEEQRHRDQLRMGGCRPLSGEELAHLESLDDERVEQLNQVARDKRDFEEARRQLELEEPALGSSSEQLAYGQSERESERGHERERGSDSDGGEQDGVVVVVRLARKRSEREEEQDGSESLKRQRRDCKVNPLSSALSAYADVSSSSSSEDDDE
jgi:hypothetical protein